MKKISGIAWAVGPNVTGLLRVKVIDTFDVLSFFDPRKFRDGLPVGNQLPRASLVLKPGAAFREIRFTPLTGGFSEKSVTDAGGDAWDTAITLQVPNDSIATAAEVALYRGRLFMAVLQDANDNFRLVGTPENPLRCGIETSTSQVGLSFTTVSPTRAYFLPGIDDTDLFPLSDFNNDFSSDFAI